MIWIGNYLLNLNCAKKKSIAVSITHIGLSIVNDLDFQGRTSGQDIIIIINSFSVYFYADMFFFI